jgi:glucose/arabinose dehydrogenase
MRVQALAATLIVVGAGCGSDASSSVAVTFHTGSTPPASVATTRAGSVAQTSSGDSVATPTTSIATPDNQLSGRPTVNFTELGTFEQPVGFTWRPSDATMYVVEQTGRVVIMNDGQPGPTALDMSARTKSGGEQGLLGLAIDADGTLAYVDYTDDNGNTEIDEYALRPDGTFDVATRRKVLAFDQPYPNHNGGELVFGPDRMLYIGTGDGGGAKDPGRRALDLGEWLGKMLRIDPRPASGAAYTVPSDNPFVGIAGAHPEIWSVGLRNPWRFSFDRQTGDLWIADVGQDSWEEVDAAWAADGRGRGMNFGWSAWEGNHRYNEDQSPDGATPPVYEYPHGDAGCSISGGVRYRGSAIPDLVGWYVYGDYCSGQVKALQISGHAVTDDITLGNVASISAVTEAPDGELLVLSVAGSIYAVTPG